jgi:hypothetical protein
MMYMPTKRAKGRFPDIENDLLTWMKSQQELGIYPSNCEIRNKALDLRDSLQCSKMYDDKLCSATWMEKFRVKIAQQ